jgi:hypothetical protein
MEKTKFTDLSQNEQDELASILHAHRQGRGGDPELARRFHSTFQDAFAWWLFLLLASVGGFVGWFMNWRISDMIEGFRLLPMTLRNFPNGLFFLARDFPLWGLPLAIIVAVWTSVIIARNYKRRGYAATSFALIRVRGNKLALVSHANVAAINWAHEGSRGKTFCVLDLKPTEGKTLRLYPSSGWVKNALEQLNQARAAAGLPQIEPTVTWGVHYRKVERQA